ncbi:MAG: hypothetical protein R8G66_31795 [Cytophagales bacterium]|nr:hypothetical protein [Cytophagales bacterium]
MFDDDEIPDGRKLPILKKGQEIDELTRRILDLIPEDNEELKEIAGWMSEDAANLSVKVSGAESGELYDIKMENAAIIRKSARELIVNTHSLRMYGFKETQYFDLLRQAVEEYRLLFIGWVATFDRWNYEVDHWGLFNPPGIGPDNGDEL